MKIRQKITILYTLIILFIFTMLTTHIAANATVLSNKNIDLVILFDDNNINENVESIVTNCGGKIINRFPELVGIEVECPADLIPTIKSVDNVQSIETNHVIKLSNEKMEESTELGDDSTNTSDDLYEKYQWDIKRVTNNGKSFSLQSGNHNVVVGIIDSGVDINHPDLVNNFLGGKNLIPAGFKNDSSETGDINDVNDRLGHGTGVAGVIAANGKIKGVAPNIGFKSYRIFNSSGETNATICSSAIIAATNDGVKVINLSINSYYTKGECYGIGVNKVIKYNIDNDMTEYSLLKRAIKYAIKNGVTVVTSAGNDNLNCSNSTDLTKYLNERYEASGFKYVGLTYSSPGNIKDVITVSATKRNDKLASYSNYGEKFIDISAPGGDTSETHDTTNMCLTADIGSGYVLTSGTSIATPKVSAVVALLICKNNDISQKSIKEKIYKSADKLQWNESSEYYGAGIINAYNAIQ